MLDPHIRPHVGGDTPAVSRCCSSSDVNASSDPYLDIVQSRCEEALLLQGLRSVKPSRGMPLLGGDALHISHRIQVHLLFVAVFFSALPCCALPCPQEVARVLRRCPVPACKSLQNPLQLCLSLFGLPKLLRTGLFPFQN